MSSSKMDMRKVSGIEFKYAKGEIDIYGNTFHEYNEIYLLLNGEVRFISSHINRVLSPYQLVIIPRGQYHQFVVSGDMESYERCIIHIYPDFPGDDTLSLALSGKELLALNENHRIVENIMHLKNALSSYSQEDFSFILPAIVTDIAFLIKQTNGTPVYFDSSIRPLSQKIMDFINKSYRKSITLEDIATAHFISVSTACHIFKEDFGISIKKYVANKRINEARLSLQEGERPEEICEKLGFTNYSTFYRAYKKYFGISPAESAKEAKMFKKI